MIVYDLVQIVRPGTPTSCRPGTWLIETFPDEVRARQTAELCNGNRLVEGLSYEVQVMDEGDVGRARYLTDVVRDARVPEGWAHVWLNSMPGIKGSIYERCRGGWSKWCGSPAVVSEEFMNGKFRNGMVERV